MGAASGGSVQRRQGSAFSVPVVAVGRHGGPRPGLADNRHAMAATRWNTHLALTYLFVRQTMLIVTTFPPARHARRRAADPPGAARRGGPAVHRARPGRRLAGRHRAGGGHVPQPGDVLLRRQGGAVRRGRLPRRAARRHRGRARGRADPHAAHATCARWSTPRSPSPALLTFAEAALLVRRRPELAPRVRETFARLHAEGERAVRREPRQARLGDPRRPVEEARGFWAAILGVVLESAAAGDTFSRASADAAVQLVLNLYTSRVVRVVIASGSLLLRAGLLRLLEDSGHRGRGRGVRRARTGAQGPRPPAGPRGDRRRARACPRRGPCAPSCPASGCSCSRRAPPRSRSRS